MRPGVRAPELPRRSRRPPKSRSAGLSSQPARTRFSAAVSSSHSCHFRLSLSTRWRVLAMTSLFDVPVDAAYHLVSALAAAATPLLGGLAAATAIVVFTMAVRLLLTPLSYLAMRGMDSQARMAPQVQALRQRHAGQPDTLQKELAVLYRAEGTTMFAGCLPLLLQWPLLSVMYLLFRSPAIDGAPNKLLSHDLFGAPLASH